MMRLLMAGMCATVHLTPPPAAAAVAIPVAAPAAPLARPRLSSNEMFGLAEAAERRGDAALVEAIYRALAKDPVVTTRNEARFRLAMRLAQARRRVESALLLRQILDEQPGSQRVRLELARLLDLMGDDGGARRMLREAQASGLPPDVVRFVDRYSAALRARKPYGASIDVAVAPDSNVNRATRSETLGTILGDFTLDEEARQQSGIGLALRGQAYARFAMSGKVTMLARLSGSADLYRKSAYNDVAIGLSGGPEIRLGADRIAIEAGLGRQYYGGKLLASTTTFGTSLLHPVGRVAHVRVAASLGTIAHRLNRLQSGRSYSASVGYERALSATSGVGGSLALDRRSLRDAGYSTRGVQATVFAYHELGATTLVGSVGQGRLVADERLFLYPRRREDRLNRFSIGATFRQLTVAGFAPFVRLTRERNRSSIDVFDTRRTRTEAGIGRAF